MQAHYLQHVPFEGLGYIETWLQDNHYQVSSTQLFNSKYQFPEIEPLDLLVILGGPMSANDEQLHPWLTKEIQFIKKAIATGIPILGICLGAQLIAKSVSSSIYPNPKKEIGWFPIRATQLSASKQYRSHKNEHFQFPNELNVFHWHGETFDLPVNAAHLAYSDFCKIQAFQLGKHIMGLQFHLETTVETARKLISQCGHEIVPSNSIQTAQYMLDAPTQYYTQANQEMTKILAFLTRDRGG